MIDQYTPNNWYWVVAGSVTEVFSSASGGYVPVADATYQAWLASAGAPTPIATEDELGEVLAKYDIAPTAPGVLDAYKTTLAKNIPLRVLFQILLNHENRVRTLEGQGTITAGQFRTGIKQLL